MKILVLGAAVLDITAQPIQKGSWAEKQRIDSINYYIGGDAANQCVRLSDVGADAAVVSAVGRDKNGEMIRSELKRRGVDTRYLFERDDRPTGTSLVLLDEKGERATFSVRGGAYATLNRADARNILTTEVTALSIASFFIEPQLEDDGGMLALLKEAKEKKILTFADLSHDKNNLGLDGIKPFLPYLDYFLPSIYDAEKMNKLKGAKANAEAYRALGCGNVVIKCGAEGCYILSNKYEGLIPAYKVEPVDTTGAGDCMVALFINEILNGKAIDEACRFACAGASYSTLFAGASSSRITRENIYTFMKNFEAI